VKSRELHSLAEIHRYIPGERGWGRDYCCRKVPNVLFQLKRGKGYRDKSRWVNYEQVGLLFQNSGPLLFEGGSSEPPWVQAWLATIIL